MYDQFQLECLTEVHLMELLPDHNLLFEPNIHDYMSEVLYPRQSLRHKRIQTLNKFHHL